MIRNLVLAYLGKNGILLDRYVSSEQVTQVLQSLTPVESGHEMIRLGSNNDGGYLLPNVLNGITACFSPGVSTNSSFEWDLAQLGIKCYLADFSVEGPPQHHPNFDFTKKHLDSISTSTTMTLSSWMGQKRTEGDLLLQMDIEGFEYSVIPTMTTEELMRFRIIILELHEFDSIVTPIGNRTIKNCLNRLLENHLVVHVHANNFGIPRRFQNKVLPRGIEVTLLRKDFIVKSSPVKQFPNLLDQPNSLIYPDVVLDANWFS